MYREQGQVKEFIKIFIGIILFSYIVKLSLFIGVFITNILQ